MEDEDIEAPKRKIIELEAELVDAQSQEKKEKVKGPSFEIKEYEFSEVQEASNGRFKSRNDLYDKYKQYKDIYSKETLNL